MIFKFKMSLKIDNVTGSSLGTRGLDKKKKKKLK